MRFLIDANLPRAIIAVVQNLGHQVEFARDIGLASATDEQIAKHALQMAAGKPPLGACGKLLSHF